MEKQKLSWMLGTKFADDMLWAELFELVVLWVWLRAKEGAVNGCCFTINFVDGRRRRFLWSSEDVLFFQCLYLL